MIFGHEGMPGSGKSYEAVAEHFVKQLSKKRKVATNIEGPNYAQLAELADISIPECVDLIQILSDEDMLRLYDVIENDSFVILDEVQNFYPSVREKLSPQMTKFIAEHRHMGVDILLMTQSFADVHSIWRRRMAKKLVFTKLDMIGAAGSYKWEAYSGQMVAGRSEPKWTKLNSGNKKYDSKYFGAYKSHQDDTENTENYKDNRTNVLHNKSYRTYAILAVLTLIFGGKFIFSFFSSDNALVKNSKVDVEVSKPPLKTQDPVVTLPTKETSIIEVPVTSKYDDELDYYFMRIMRSNNARLTGQLHSKDKFLAFIEVSDDSFRVKDTFSTKDLIKAGYIVNNKSYGLIVRYKDEQLLIRPTPVDTYGKVGSQQMADYRSLTNKDLTASSSAPSKSQVKHSNTSSDITYRNPYAEAHGRQQIGGSPSAK